jgi:hypothetical protein
MIFMLSYAYMAILSPTQHILDHKTPIGHKPYVGEMWIVDMWPWELIQWPLLKPCNAALHDPY